MHAAMHRIGLTWLQSSRPPTTVTAHHTMRSAETGKERWYRDATGFTPFWYGVDVFDGVAYAPTGSILMAVKVDNGDVKWDRNRNSGAGKVP